ncbi:lysozyme 2 [Anabrus simplex]|uniref:lysozyme 2 n=1 Tax=Anabrus simplex TaxID=316456 RepID=UPI0035A309AF
METPRTILASAIGLALVAVISSVYVSNLHSACLRCLCEAASGCNMTLYCRSGYCGPFYISRVYWVSAGRPVTKYDDPERDAAYNDCANDYNCAKTIVQNYMAIYGKDCNGDGTTDCDDYAMIHYNGGQRCETSIEGTNFNRRYMKCRPPLSQEETLVRTASAQRRGSTS